MSRNRKITASEAKAIEMCAYATTQEIDRAYSRNSMWGDGAACAVLLRELDKRSGRSSSSDEQVAFLEASTLPDIRRGV